MESADFERRRNYGLKKKKKKKKKINGKQRIRKKGETIDGRRKKIEWRQKRNKQNYVEKKTEYFLKA